MKKLKHYHINKSCGNKLTLQEKPKGVLQIEMKGHQTILESHIKIFGKGNYIGKYKIQYYIFLVCDFSFYFIHHLKDKFIKI